MYMGKFEYFTNLNSSAMNGDDSSIKTIIYGEVVGWGRDEIYPDNSYVKLTKGRVYKFKVGL